MVIPSRLNDTREFWEKLAGYYEISHKINEHEITFLIEPTKGNYKYHCTIEDIAYLLSFVPEEDISIIDLIIFRQPKAKEEIISSAWGRLGFNVNIGKYYGPAIIIEVIDMNKHLSWRNSLEPNGLKELVRLQEEGHKITRNKRKYTIEMSSESIRATQLYRTLFHEIGHWVQCADITLREENNRNDTVYNDYSEIPHVQKEIFAHRYADKIK